MSDSKDTTGATGTTGGTQEPLRYIGATTRHEGTGDEPQSLPEVPASKLPGELQPGVTGDAEPQRRKDK